MSKVSLKGVTIGAVTDIVATGILAIPLMIYVVVRFDLVQTPRDQATGAITSAIHGSAPLYAVQLLIGLACSSLGCYVAARIARHDELLNGLLSSFLCVALGIYSLASGKAPGSFLVQLLLLFASAAFGMMGGYLRLLQKRGDR